MKKIIFIIAIILIVLCLGVVGYFGIAYLIAPTEIVISLNNKVLDTSKIDDTLTYNEDILVSWDNTHYKVFCNDIEIVNGSSLNQNGTYNLMFKFKDTIKSFQIVINKDLTFTIQDYDGNTIHNYTTNYKPFKIISTDEIKVNNSNFDISNGIYKIGDYKITSKDFDSCIVKINGISEPNEYNFYITSNTLPTLYATLDIVSSDKQAYIWYGKENMLNNDQLKLNQNITVSEFSGNSEALIYSVLDEVKSKIKEIFESDKNAYFHLYTDDTRHWLEYPLFAELGLDSLRYDITYYSEGDKSYENDKLEYSYVNDDDYKLFLQIQSDETKLLNEVKSNKYPTTRDYLLGLLPRKLEYINDYILPSTFRNNVKYILEYPELITFKDEKINTALKNNNNIYKLTFIDGYNDLNDNQKEVFFKYINFNKEEFKDTYLNKNNNKDYLVITDDGITEKDDIETLLKKSKEKYGNDYNILFRSDTNYTDILDELDIPYLPTNLPLELITTIYEDIKLGGFETVEYMNIKKENILFLFANNKEDLKYIKNSLEEDFFKDIEFIPNIKEKK